MIWLSDPTHMMSMANLVSIRMETLRIDSGYSLEKEFMRLIYISLLMILYLTVNQVDSCHSYVCGCLT